MTRLPWKLTSAAAISIAILSSSSPGGAGTGNAADRGANRQTVAVIGDVPYGTAQEATFGNLIGAVNADPKVRTVLHVGDVKSGSTTCTNERFTAVSDAFATFEDPVVYTPGDNEWTDCHRLNNGAYNPIFSWGLARNSRSASVAVVNEACDEDPHRILNLSVGCRFGG